MLKLRCLALVLPLLLVLAPEAGLSQLTSGVSLATPPFVKGQNRPLAPAGGGGDPPTFVVTAIERMARDAALTSRRNRRRGRGSCFADSSADIAFEPSGENKTSEPAQKRKSLRTKGPLVR